MSSMTWLAPAKLNLMLHITGRNEQNYHCLQTVFQLLDYGDELTFTPNQNHRIDLFCQNPDLVNTNNLILRAANALSPFAKNKQGFDILLDKKLPMGGGVGGGSSDAATTLLALNHYWQCGLSINKLAQIGLSLGADVPVFIHGKTSWAEGIGEQLSPCEIEPFWYLVVQPDCFVSTAKIFSHKALTRNCEISTIRAFLANGGPKHGFNVMESIVTELYPEVKAALDWLKQHNTHSRMTGSGSCVFAPFDNEREMRKIASRCQWPHFVARGVNQSPTHIQMQKLSSKS